jgi:hypothetical protein
MIVKKGIVEHLDAENAQIVFRPVDAELFPVKNEGRIYDPPKNHLGKSWTSNKALAVAQAVQYFMEKTVPEGESYIVE